MRQRWFRQILQHRFFIILLLLLQTAVLIVLILNTSLAASWVSGILYFIGIMASLKVVSSREKPTYKLLWVFMILLLPVFGTCLYLLLTCQTSPGRVNQKLEKLSREIHPFLPDGEEEYRTALRLAPGCVSQITYLQQAGFPVCRHTRCTYFPSGEAAFERLCKELKNAGKYIFLEFFIIQEGKMWNTILEILKEKARQGLQVRVIYDDIGCFLTLPKDYPKRLAEYGIECRIFNPFRPILSSLQNNRDHRKIVSIDGITAFTGGFNLADEYINEVEKYGHWRDCGLLVKGKAAWSLTAMFLQNWNLAGNTREDIKRYLPSPTALRRQKCDGLVQAYSDAPVNKENVGEHVYLQIINNAKKYLYINTPYMIIDDSMVSALSLAAKSGVDVRIITPHHWDKMLIHMTTRSYYRPLLESGVKIYEYTSGFNHAKTFVSDDRTATVGTFNLDYRSLYLHFECGVWMYNTKAVLQVKKDFLTVLPDCTEIRIEDCPSGVVFTHFQEWLRLFAPLM